MHQRLRLFNPFSYRSSTCVISIGESSFDTDTWKGSCKQLAALRMYMTSTRQHVNVKFLCTDFAVILSFFEDPWLMQENLPGRTHRERNLLEYIMSRIGDFRVLGPFS